MAAALVAMAISQPVTLVLRVAVLVEIMVVAAQEAQETDKMHQTH
jgi:hypothetical protein